MNTDKKLEKNSDHPKPTFKIGDLVVIKSYPDKRPISGDPLHIQPIMVVIGIEIENKKKKIYDNDLGEVIADRIKYNLLWFDNKKSTFIEKILYQSFLKLNTEMTTSSLKYEFGGVREFITLSHELEKTKQTTSSNKVTKTKKGIMQDDEDVNYVKTDSLLTFCCPNLVITGIKKNETKGSYDDFGNLNKIFPEKLIKVIWFNPNLQKYSEFELPKECLKEL